MSLQNFDFYGYDAYAYNGIIVPKDLTVQPGDAIYTKLPSNAQYVGTVGLIVNYKGKKMLLSNQHVFFPVHNGKMAQVGSQVYKAGDPRPIAKTLKTIAESNPWAKGKEQEALSKIGSYHDSAIAEPVKGVKIIDDIKGGVGKPNGIGDPKSGVKVKMFGKTSGFQRGKITDDSVNRSVPVSATKVSIREDVFLVDIKHGAGDSGSAIIRESDNAALGLLYATEKNLASCCKMSVIAKKYGLTVSKSSAKPTPEPEPEPEPKPVPTPFPDIGIELPQIPPNMLLIGGAGIIIIAMGAMAMGIGKK